MDFLEFLCLFVALWSTLHLINYRVTTIAMTYIDKSYEDKDVARFHMMLGAVCSASWAAYITIFL